MRRPRVRPEPRPGHACCGGPDRESTQSLAPGTRPPQQHPRGPGRGQPNAPSHRPPPHRAALQPERDATLADQDPDRDRSPRPTPDAPLADHPTTPSGRQQIGRGDDGTAPVRPIRSTPRLPPARRPRRRLPGSRPHATTASRRRMGSAAAVSSNRCVSGGSDWNCRSKFCSTRLTTRARARETEAARQLGRRQPAGQLQEGQRVAARLGHDAIPHLLVQPPAHRRCQHQARVAVAEPLDCLLRQSRELAVLAGLTNREHQGHWVGHQASSNKRQSLQRGPVEPLSIIDQAGERLVRPPPRTADPGRQDRPGSDPAHHRGGARTRPAAHRPVASASARSGRASVRTAGAEPPKANSISDSTPTTRATRKPDATLDK